MEEGAKGEKGKDKKVEEMDRLVIRVKDGFWQRLRRKRKENIE